MMSSKQLKTLILYLMTVIRFLPLMMIISVELVTSKQVAVNAQSEEFPRHHNQHHQRRQKTQLTSLYLKEVDHDNDDYKEIKPPSARQALIDQSNQICKHKQVQHLEERLDRLALNVAKLKSTLSLVGGRSIDGNNNGNGHFDDYELDDRDRDSICKQLDCPTASHFPLRAEERNRLQVKREISTPRLQPPAAARISHARHRSRRYTPELPARSHNFRLNEANRDEAARRGLDGVPGVDGAPGLDGIPGRDGRNGRDGVDGRDGRDGKDGAPGERGLPGPAGPQGEPGRRGKPGPQGKTGPPGPPGLCAYEAKLNCSLMDRLGGNDSTPTAAILLAPVMIGHETGGQSVDLERQVTVNEGDNIQLSCEASGQPRPSYIWRRSSASQSSEIGAQEADSSRLSSASGDSRAGQGSSTSTTTILFDVGANIRISSFAGGQMPLARVDRLQAGGYECLASNGIPPSAVKRISLDVNYAPTVRLYPASRVQLVHLGSSHQVECLVEANPSAFTYWTFGSNSMMSVAVGESSSAGSRWSEKSSSSRGDFRVDEDSSVAAASAVVDADEGPDSRQQEVAAATHKRAVNQPTGSGDGTSRVGKSRSTWSLANKHIITESTGQLNSGAYYTILTLNITNITEEDLGVYKCVSKNLLSQSIGYFYLDKRGAESNDARDEKLKQLALKYKSSLERQLNPTLGWPSYLVDRISSVDELDDHDEKGQYLTFGNEHRQARADHLFDERQGALLAASNHLIRPFVYTSAPIATSSTTIDDGHDNGAKEVPEFSGARGNKATDSLIIHSSADPNSSPGESVSQWPSSSSPSLQAQLTTNSIDLGGNTNDEFDLCRLESSNMPAISRGAISSHLPATSGDNEAQAPQSIMLLDQVGKPVYVGNSDDRMTPLSWWSMDTKISSASNASGANFATNAAADDLATGQEQSKRRGRQQHYFATMINVTDHLFEYDTLQALLADKSPIPSSPEQIGVSGRRLHKLKHLIHGTSHLIYNGHFIYVSLAAAGATGKSDPQIDESKRDYGFPSSSLQIVIYKLDEQRYNYIKLNGNNNNNKLARHFLGQPADSGSGYKLNRIELASDENGVWVIVPTINYYQPQTNAKPPTGKWPASNNNNNNASASLSPAAGVDRLTSLNPQIRRHRRLHVLKIKSTLVNDLDDNLAQLSPSSSPSSSSSSSSLSQLSQQEHGDKSDNNDKNHLLSRADDGTSSVAGGATSATSNNLQTMISYHVSMKLDWQMIGQLFIIDGVLYGIKDRHLYSSKLQFAYDLYKCKLMPSQYLNAPHRIFTNHFGNTQMIKYNPNEPKRLYTIDNGNLLWCPVKLDEMSELLSS